MHENTKYRKNQEKHVVTLVTDQAKDLWPSTSGFTLYIGVATLRKVEGKANIQYGPK